MPLARVGDESASIARPSLSWSSAYILIISRMIGSGIFAVPGIVIQSTGGIGTAFMAWICGAAIATIAVVPYLEYSCMLPRNGGDAVYLEFTYDKPRYLVPTIIACKALFQALTANNCIIFGKYVAYGAGVDPSSWQSPIFAISLLLAVTIMHGFFPKIGVAVQNTFGIFKIAVMTLMGCTATAVILFRSSNQRGADGLSSFKYSFKGPEPATVSPSDSTWNPGILSVALFRVQYAYSGTANANNILSEVADPVGMIKRIVPLSLVSVCALYLLLNAALVIIVPLDEIKDAGELAMAVFLNRILGPSIGNMILPIFAATVVAGNIMVGVYSEARLNQEIARRGFLPKIFASSLPSGSPLGGVIINVIPALLIILCSPGEHAYSFLVDIEGYITQFFAIAIAIGLLSLRQKHPELSRPFKAWKWVIYLRIAICIVLIVIPVVFYSSSQNYFGLWQGTYAIAAISILLGAVIYWGIWAKIIPFLRGHDLEENEVRLIDGTVVRRIVSVPYSYRSLEGFE